MRGRGWWQWFAHAHHWLILNVPLSVHTYIWWAKSIPICFLPFARLQILSTTLLASWNDIYEKIQLDNETVTFGSTHLRGQQDGEVVEILDSLEELIHSALIPLNQELINLRLLFCRTSGLKETHSTKTSQKADTASFCLTLRCVVPCSWWSKYRTLVNTISKLVITRPLVNCQLT